MSVRLDRVQQGLFAALNGIAPDILWVNSEVPFGGFAGDVLTLDVTSGPTLGHRKRAQSLTLAPADSLLLRIDSVTAAARNIIKLNEHDYYYDTATGDTVTDIRDALLADIQSGESGAVTAVPSGADAISLTADFLGGLRSLSLVGPITSSALVFSGDAVAVTEATTTMLVTLQAYSADTEPRNGAVSVVDAALDRLRAQDVLDELIRFGVAIWHTTDTTDLSAIASTHWESRAAASVTIAARSVFVRPVEQIETVVAAIAIDGASTITASASAP